MEAMRENYDEAKAIKYRIDRLKHDLIASFGQGQSTPAFDTGSLGSEQDPLILTV